MIFPHISNTYIPIPLIIDYTSSWLCDDTHKKLDDILLPKGAKAFLNLFSIA